MTKKKKLKTQDNITFSYVEKEKRSIAKNHKTGRYTVIDDEVYITKKYKKDIRRVRYCKCLCECGNIRYVRTNYLLDNTVISCGCYTKGVNSKRLGRYYLANKDIKKCSKCGLELEISKYSKNKRAKDGLNSKCYDCLRGIWLKRRYNIDEIEYNQLLEKQNRACACCGTTNPKTVITNKHTKNYPIFCVDHCHKTGMVRGLLCHNCNNGIGCLGDTSKDIKNALDYLLKFENENV